MGQNFLSCDRDQVLLLPPDLREWLPDDHLARFVVETVAELDLTALYGYYRQDGRGRPAHDPAMMVCLVLYAYAVGVTSSRAIERRCVEDVAFRVIAANRQPDHATIARFLIRHQDALEELFFQVLALCQRAGLLRAARVAVDSTKLAANASAGQNRTLEGLREEARRVIGEAIETDRREDELFGDKRGDELPEELADPRTRKARIRQLLDELEREAQEIHAEHERLRETHQEHLQRTGHRKPGRPVGTTPGYAAQRKLNRKVNLTDPDSTVVHHRGMRIQGYAVQTAATEDQIVLAAVAHAGNDQAQLAPTVEQAQRNLRRLAVAEPIREVLADSGYWNIRQISELQKRARVLVPPPTKAKDPAKESVVARQMRAELKQDAAASDYRRRQAMVEPVYAYWKTRRGITRLYRRGKAKVQAEITLIATTHNLLKLHTAQAAG